MTEPDPFMTVKDAAAALGVSRSTVHQRKAEGKLEGQMVAGRLVIRRDSVERLRRQMRRQSKAAA